MFFRFYATLSYATIRYYTLLYATLRYYTLLYTTIQQKAYLTMFLRWYTRLNICPLDECNRFTDRSRALLICYVLGPPYIIHKAWTCILILIIEWSGNSLAATICFEFGFFSCCKILGMSHDLYGVHLLRFQLIRRRDLARHFKKQSLLRQ
jgi:hypothetical protein